MGVNDGNSPGLNTDELAPRDPAAQYVVVARRYRPQTFTELIGQEHVAKALTGAIAANRVGHAYLFTGARGVGKTSAARILAKALNCVHGPTPTPCNQCDICQSISAGSDVDVLEIDGASNRGIDEIRQLRSNVNIRPSRARFKIYIIDEVHMLTREAFNALLKTLEEPPEHVKFIFCTTEATKIPITILSRCQRFDFAGIEMGSIVERLKQIVTIEGATAEDEALAILARRAGGSMRDSQSLLEQMLAAGDHRITVADVHAMLGTAAEARLSELVGHLTARDAAAALGDFDAAMAEGVDVGQLLEQLLGYFRDCMVAAVGCPSDVFLNASSAAREQAVSTARQLGVETILAVMQIIDHTLGRLRYSTQGRTLAEMALVRIARLENLDALADLIAQVQAGGSVALPAPAASMTSPVPASPIAKKKAELTNGQPSAPVDAPAANPSLDAATELTAETAPIVWKEALASLSDLLAENAALAESVAAGGADRLVVAFREKYTSGKAFCERPDQFAKLQTAVNEAAGGRVKVEFVVLPDQETRPQSRRAAPQRQRLAEKSDHPLVRRAAELFNAHIVRVEEPDKPSP